VGYRVGSVPYLNSKPLVKPLEWRGEVFVEYAVPSRLPQMLNAGPVDAIMVSSIYALTTPGSRVAAGISIGTQRDVVSVRLFSKVPPAEIQSVAWDASSMTSNALAKIVLAERYGAVVSGSSQPPVLSEMLARHDACVLIGDNGMAASDEGLWVLDLGHEWHALTGLPFVWALWVGRDRLTPELVGHLQRAVDESRGNWELVIQAAVEETGFSEDQCRHYLTEIMDYRLTEGHRAGLEEFGRLAVKHGAISDATMPEIVESEPALSR
jgi:chorismate dehydratase